MSNVDAPGGGALPGMSLEAFMDQAQSYEDEDDLFSRHTRFWSELSLTHPVAVRRVKELTAWVNSGELEQILRGMTRATREGALSISRV